MTTTIEHTADTTPPQLLAADLTSVIKDLRAEGKVAEDYDCLGIARDMRELAGEQHLDSVSDDQWVSLLASHQRAPFPVAKTPVAETLASDYQCPEHDWCDNGCADYPCCMGEHFWQGYTQASLGKNGERRDLDESTPLIVGMWLDDRDLVPPIVITVGDDTEAIMSIVEARKVLADLARAIEIADPFWRNQPDVLKNYQQLL